MFARVVVGIDGSRRSAEAIALAESLAGPEGGRILLAHAFPFAVFPDRMYAATGSPAPRHVAEAMLERFAVATGADVECVAAEDSSPARALLDLAEREAADLIVIASSHRGAVGRALLGDVGAQTVRAARCPVAVAPRGWVRPGRLAEVGVAFDGSQEARLALARAEPVARSARGRLSLIHVIREPAAYLTAFPYETGVADSYQAAYEQAHDLVAPVVDGLGQWADAEILLGDPIHELAERTADLDVLFVGSRGRGPVRRGLLGSTSTGLLHHARCPVVVVPHGEHVGDSELRRSQGSTQPTVTPRSLV